MQVHVLSADILGVFTYKWKFMREILYARTHENLCVPKIIYASNKNLYIP